MISQWVPKFSVIASELNSSDTTLPKTLPMPSCSPVKPDKTKSHARTPIWLLTPVKRFRTVPPSSIVRRLVAKLMFELTLSSVFICSVLNPAKRATPTAAHIVPHVPCGCIDMRRFVAIPTRAPTSYPMAIAVIKSLPLVPWVWE